MLLRQSKLCLRHFTGPVYQTDWPFQTTDIFVSVTKLTLPNLLFKTIELGQYFGPRERGGSPTKVFEKITQ